METATSANTLPPQLPTNFFWKKGIFIAIIFFIVGGLVVFVGSKLPQPLEKPVIQPKGTPKPTAQTLNKIILIERTQPLIKTDISPKVLSVSKENKITVFDPKTEQSSLIPIQTSCCGGGLYEGVIDPLLSPTYQRIAYINKEDNNIWILNTDGKDKIKISTQGLLETELFWGTNLSLAGWSSDGKWLVYHVNISDEGMGIDPQDKLQPPVVEGFYAANLREGMVYLLPNLPNFVDFLPQADSVVFVKEFRKEGQSNQTDLYTYDLATGAVEKLSKESIKGTFVGQFSFSSDKKHFAYMIAETEPSSSRLIYASLDNIDKQGLVTGQFADIQFPKISPDGRLIAYEKHTPATCPGGGGGCPQPNLVTYNLEDNKEKDLGQIKKILYWFDNSRVVVIGGSYTGPWSLQLIDITSGSVKTITNDEALRNR